MYGLRDFWNEVVGAGPDDSSTQTTADQAPPPESAPPPQDEAPVSEAPEEPPVAEAPEEPPVSEEPTADAPEEPPVSEAPEEPPAYDVPEEPPASETPEEPPTYDVPEEPPADTPEEPPVSEMPEEPPAYDVPEEPPVSETPEEPPTDAPEEPPVSETPEEPPTDAPEEPPVSETPEEPPSDAPEEPPVSETPEDPPTEPQTLVLQSLRISPAAPSVGVGGEQQFSAIGSFSDGSTQDMTSAVVWSSSSPNVVTIDNDGLASAVSVGSAVIMVKDEVTFLGDQTNFTVTAGDEPPEPAQTRVLQSIRISPAAPSVDVDGEQQFSAIGAFDDGSTEDMTSAVVWTSSSPNVATIDSDGLASALGVGSAVIMVKDEVSLQADQTNFTVRAPEDMPGPDEPTDKPPRELQMITITPANDTMKRGERKPMTATGQYSDGSTEELTLDVSWSASPQGLVSMDGSGVVTAENESLGVVTITATYAKGTDSISATTDITVIEGAPSDGGGGAEGGDPGTTPPLPVPAVAVGGGSEAGRLLGMAQALDSIKQGPAAPPYTEGFQMTLGGKQVELTPADVDANRRSAQAAFANAAAAVRGRCSDAQGWYSGFKADITKGVFNNTVTWILNGVAVTDPGPVIASLCSSANSQAGSAVSAANGNQFRTAASALIAADTAASKAKALADAYARNIINAAETTVTVLEGVKMACEFTLSVAGGPVGFAGGLAITAADDLAPLAYGDFDKVEWDKFVIDMAFKIVMKKLGPQMQQAILNQIGTNVLEKAGETAVKKVLSGILVKQYAIALRKAIEIVRTGKKDITWGQFVNEVNNALAKDLAKDLAKEAVLQLGEALKN